MHMPDLSASRVERTDSRVSPLLWEIPAPVSPDAVDVVLAHLQDTTLRLLIASGLFSLALAAWVPSAESQGTEWVEGAAILASVAIVVGAGAASSLEYTLLH
jgi:hypothetical protein